MISLFYGAILIISFIMVPALYEVQGKKNKYFELVFLSILIGNFGYFSLSISQVVEEALLANRIIYLSSCLLPVFLLVSLCELCKLDIPRKVVVSLVLSGFIIMALTWTAGYTDIYYKSVSLGSKYGGSYLIKEYGVFHQVYKIWLLALMLIMIIVVLHAYLKRKDVSHRTTMLLTLVIFVNIAVYIVERIVNIEVELMPVVYLIDEVMLLSIFRKIGMYDMTNNMMIAERQVEDFGYITLDMKKKYMGCNEFAKEYLPELSNYRIDHHITKYNGLFYLEILQRLQRFEETGKWEDFYIQIGAHYLQCSIKYLHYGKKHRCIGYLITLSDATRQQNFVQVLNKYNDDLESKVEEKTRHIRQIQDKILISMADMVESRDNNTGGHIKRTNECVRIFVEKLKEYPDKYPYSNVYFNNVIKAAPMHDLGKIAVDDRILRKPGRYTPEEYEEMKQHSAKGAEIVRMVLENVEDEALLETAVNVAHYHHEKWDGSGYPEHLKGEQIPLEARIMALADVFDALVSKRCYKEAYDFKRAFAIIEESLGSHFDENLGRIFLQCKDELVEFYQKQFSEEERVSSAS